MPSLQIPAPTFEDVWRTIQELALQSKQIAAEAEQRRQETERLIKENAVAAERRSQEAERRAQEAERRFQETERLMKERAADLDIKLKKLTQNLGDLGNRLGEYVEHMVAPAVVRLFQAQGVDVHEVHQGIEAKRNGEAIEIDLLVVNDGSLVAVECKSKLTLEYVDGHLKRMEKLKRLLPTYREHRAFGAVAAMVVSDSVKEYAHSQGLYVLSQNGDTVEVSTPAGFTAKVW